MCAEKEGLGRIFGKGAEVEVECECCGVGQESFWRTRKWVTLCKNLTNKKTYDSGDEPCRY